MQSSKITFTILLLIYISYSAGCQKENPVGGEEIIPPDFSDDLDPAWSPDGSTIAFTHRPVAEDTSGGPFGIYFVDPDGTNRRPFFLGAHSAAWSSDGQKLAFVYNGISIMNKDSSGFRSFDVEGFFPAWSPDGKKIAYSTGGGGSTFLIDLSKDVVATPVKFLDNAFYPDWSPDGKQLVFGRRETPFSSPSIYKANLNGTALTEIAQPVKKGDEHRYPTYSHSGDKIAFSAEQKGIVTIDSNGKNEKRIYKKLSQHPSWSPDDGYIVFHGATDTPARARLFIMKRDGTDLRQLTF